MKHQQQFARLLGSILIAWTAGLGACDAPSSIADNRNIADIDWESDCPDPSVRVAIAPGDGFFEERALGEQLGAYRLYKAFGDAGTRVVVTFFERAAGETGSLEARVVAHAERTNRQLLDALPGKGVVPLDSVTNNPFDTTGYAWRAFAYPTGAGGTTVCDAAALMGATPGGVWTVSWNAGVGALDDAEGDIAAFLAGFTIEPVASH